MRWTEIFKELFWDFVVFVTSRVQGVLLMIGLYLLVVLAYASLPLAIWVVLKILGVDVWP